MRIEHGFWLAAMFALTCGIVGEGVASARAQQGAASTDLAPSADKSAVSAHLSALPLRFEPNLGQFDDRVSFLARGPAYRLFLTREGATLALHGEGDDDAQSPVVTMHVLGGRAVQPTASEPQEGRSNYFIGNDPSKWRTGVEGYARVRYPAVLPGVDVVYYGTGQRRLEYDLVLAPGVDPTAVTVAFDGAESVAIDGQGSAVLRLPGGTEVIQPAPVAYQVGEDGSRQPVEARYELRDAGLGFAVGARDGTRELVIDPSLVYSTYLGGTLSEQAYGIAVDSAGEAFVTGYTNSTNFPTVSPFQAAHAADGGSDAFVTKLNAAGSALVYSTYLGGNSGDTALGIAVDSVGEAFVTGTTSSTNFPTAFPFQAAFGGAQDAFVTKLNATGSALVYSTYLGGDSADTAYGIAVDSSVGEAFVTGVTMSTNFPTAFPFQAAHAADGGGFEAFVTKLNDIGSNLIYSTYLGGNSLDIAQGIAVDSVGEAFVAGYTGSTDFPTASPFQAAYAGVGRGDYDAFVTKFNAAGSALVYSTYLGGNSLDYAQGIAVDSEGEAFVTGSTTSTNFPTVSPFQAAHATDGGSYDVFVTKLNAAGSALVYSTYLGGSVEDHPWGIAIDSAGEAFVTGYTNSTNFPTLSPFQAAQADRGGGTDAFVTKFNPAGSALVYSSYLGGKFQDVARGIAVDSAGEAFVTGWTESTTFPTTAPFQAANGGGYDAFIAKISGPVFAVPAMGRYTPWLAGLLLLLAGARGGPRGARRGPART